MNQKRLKLVYIVAIVSIFLLVIEIGCSVYDQAKMSGQPTEVKGAVRDRGDYIDVLLTIRNHKDTDAIYKWDIILFHGSSRAERSFSDIVKGGSGLQHITSFAAPQDKVNLSAGIKVYEKGKLIEERVYYLNDS